MHLPPKLLQDGAKRLVFLAPVTAAFIVVVEVGEHYLQPALAPVFRDPVNRLLTIAVVFVGLGIRGLHMARAVSDTTLLRLGMAFAILVSACISAIETTLPFPPGVPVTGVSAVGPWLFMFAAFVPARPTTSGLVALASATMFPLMYTLNMFRHDFPPLPFNQLVVWPGVNYLHALLAILVVRRLYGASIAAERAVELGSYRLVAPIGEGGMGEIWQATHQMLARKAAVKIIKPEGMSDHQAEMAAKRFQREANLIANLQSPNTVYLYDFGTSRDGRFYYVMELLDGISLQTLVSRFGPQPAGRVAHIVRQVCESLEEAHQHSVIHRDLKPSNIMLCKVGLAHDVVKVLDFGLAKSIAPTDNVTQLTMDGVASGTPGYISPEVAIGERAVDHRADIYSLGCVAYYLLTGTLVFQDSNPVSLALKHVQATPDPPSSRTELAIPAGFEALVLACLAKSPADRPASAAAIAARLEQCDVPRWRPEHADAWWANHLPPTSSLRANAPATSTPHILQRI